MSLVASLDMGSNKMAMALASYDGHGSASLINVKIVASRGIKEGVITDREKVSQCLKKMLGELLKNRTVDTIQVALSGSSLMIKKREVAVNLPRHVVEPRDLALADKQCEDAVDYRDEELVDKVVVSYNIDGDDSIIDPLGKQGRVLRVLYYQYIAYRDYLTKVRQLLGDLGFVKVNFVPQTRVYREAIYTDLEHRKIALVDLGESSIKIALFSDTLLLSEATLPIGVGSIDTDISGAFKIDLGKANQLKHDEGNALRSLCKNKKVTIPETKQLLDSKDLSTVVQSRMEELLIGVTYVLQKSGIKESLDNILLTGGGCRLCNVDTLLNRLSECNVERAYVSEVDVPREDILKTPEFFVVLGLLKCISFEQEAEEGIISKILKRFWN